jgi:uncharacterized protein (DUF302 family)
MPSVNISDDKIFYYVQKMMNHLDETNRLQQLAKDNGIEIKNEIDLSEDARKKVIIATTAMLLAKRSGDPDYDMLRRTGLQKREYKARVINKYKDEAQQLINRVENNITTD